MHTNTFLKKYWLEQVNNKIDQEKMDKGIGLLLTENLLRYGQKHCNRIATII